MGALGSSGVTILRTWEEGDRTRRSVQKCVEATLVLSSQGGATNSVGAGLFGLDEIHESSPAIADGNVLFPTSPSYDKSLLLFFNIANATDASRDDPADVSDTVRVIVKGKSL